MLIELLQWIPTLIGLFIAGANCAIFVIIKFNDLVHLNEKLSEVADQLKEMDKKLDKNVERIAKIEGKCSANHG
jgi:hypothetical protein